MPKSSDLFTMPRAGAIRPRMEPEWFCGINKIETLGLSPNPFREIAGDTFLFEPNTPSSFYELPHLNPDPVSTLFYCA
jgi:hypothetical protein